jgi:cell wall-associated NlpC family hydrolase
MTDGIAGVQTRIQEIQQRFGPSTQSTSATTASGEQTFAEMLSAASSLGTDGTGDGAAATAPLDPLLTQLTGSGLSGTDLGGLLGSTGLLGASGMTGTGTTSSTALSNGLGTIGSSNKTQAFLQNALAQAGDPYVWGATASPTDPNPKAFDCSELVTWAAKRVGVDLQDGSWLQYLQLKQQGATIPVQQALQTPGALLFSFSQEPTPGGGRPSHAHVAISLGNGRTIEARGRSYGVGSFDAGNRFQYAAVVPGLAA